MAVNKSVERFRALTLELQKEVRANAIVELNRQAELLRSLIESVAPVYQGEPAPGVEPGALKSTVYLVPDRSKDTVVRVVAGGPKTTTKGEKPFDYSRAVEFGTQNTPAHPFFFPSYRLSKKRMISAMKRRIAANIKKYSAEGKNV